MATATETETIQLDSTTEVYRGRTCHRGEDEDEDELLAQQRREDRKLCAEEFREEYFYCRCQDNKTCIWSGGCAHSWSDDSCGITWAGVHGENSICVVTRTGDLDVSRVHGYLIFEMADEVFRNFRRAVISELEDLADPSSELRRKLDKNISLPFGVVSVAPLSDKVHKASCKYEETKFVKLMVEGLIREAEGASSDESEIDEEFDEDDEDARIKHIVKSTRRSWRAAPNNDPKYDKHKSIRFIQNQNELKRGASMTIDEESSDKFDDKMAKEFLLKKMMEPVGAFSLDETVKTAISAFERLCNKNFNADDIQVSVMDPDYFVSADDDWDEDIYVRHLETVEIDKYLSDIKADQEVQSLFRFQLGKRQYELTL